MPSVLVSSQDTAGQAVELTPSPEQARHRTAPRRRSFKFTHRFVSASYPGIRSLDNGTHHIVTLFAGE
jgi:hypothetical protein